MEKQVTPGYNPQLILDGLWRQLAESEQTEKELVAAAKTQARQYPEIRRFEALSGIGFINAATISAILETPYRFANKRKLWMYAGLGIMERSSGGKTYSKKLSTDYNRLLKYTMKQATESAIRAADNPFQRKYFDMTVKRGIAPHRAKSGHAGYHVGHLEKRREVRSSNKRASGLQTRGGSLAILKSMYLNSDCDQS
jgi:transposase